MFEGHSAEERGQHSPTSCQGMYAQYLMPCAREGCTPCRSRTGMERSQQMKWVCVETQTWRRVEIGRVSLYCVE